MRRRFLFHTNLTLFLAFALGLPSPALALRQPSVEGTGLEELERKLSPSAGLEQSSESKDPRWQRVHERIKSVLRRHPGGRLTAGELATLADVSIRTLYAHDYRTLVAEENARRGAMKRPRRAIDGLGAASAGMEEVWFRYDGENEWETLGRRQSLQPIGMGRWLPPLTALEAAAISSFVYEDYRQIPRMIWAIRSDGYQVLLGPKRFAASLSREEVAALLNFLHDLQELRGWLDPPYLRYNASMLFSDQIPHHDPRVMGLPPEAETARHEIVEEHDFWTRQFEGVVSKALELRTQEGAPFATVGLQRMGERYYQKVPRGGSVVLFRDLRTDGFRLRLADAEIKVELVEDPSGDPSRSRWEVINPDGTRQMVAGGHHEFYVGRDGSYHPARRRGVPVVGLWTAGDVEVTHALVRRENWSAGGRPVPVIVVQDLRSRHGTYVERSAQGRARSSAEGALDEVDRLLQERGRAREALVKMLAVLEEVAGNPRREFNDWERAGWALRGGREILTAEIPGALGPVDLSVLDALDGILAGQPPEAGLPEDFEDFELAIRFRLETVFSTYWRIHRQMSFSEALRRRWFPHQFLEETLRAWDQVAAVTGQPAAVEARRPLLVAFYDPSTFYGMLLPARGGQRLLVFVRTEDEAREVRLLLAGAHVAADHAQIHVVSDMEQDRTTIAGPLASGHEIHWVDPTRPDWLEQLTEKLREYGVTLTGDVTGALLAGERYFSRFL